MNTSSVSHALPPAGSPTPSDGPAKASGLSFAGERSALEAAARAGGVGPEGQRTLLGAAAGKAYLAHIELPGGLSAFAHLLRQPRPLEDEPPAGAGRTGHPRSPSRAEEGPGRAGAERRATPVDPLDGAGSRMDPLQAPVALSLPVSDTEAAAPAEARAHVTLEDLVPALVRKIAWSGDGSRGAVHLELGGGALSGATLLVRAEEGRVRVHLTAPSGTDLDAWRTRIASRLAGRGLLVDEIEVE